MATSEPSLGRFQGISRRQVVFTAAAVAAAAVAAALIIRQRRQRQKVGTSAASCLCLAGPDRSADCTMIAEAVKMAHSSSLAVFLLCNSVGDLHFHSKLGWSAAGCR